MAWLITATVIGRQSPLPVDMELYDYWRALLSGHHHPAVFRVSNMIERKFYHKNRVGHIMVRHMCADGLESRPSPSFGCLKWRPMTSVKSSMLTLALGSNE